MTNEELEVLANSSLSEDRCCAANHGYGLDKLVKDENEYVRLIARRMKENKAGA